MADLGRNFGASLEVRDTRSPSDKKRTFKTGLP